MDDLISRKALLEKAWEADTQCGYVQVVDVGDIENAPAVDAAPVVRGEWIELHEENGHEVGTCSHCRHVRIVDNYCPNCGALMDDDCGIHGYPLTDDRCAGCPLDGHCEFVKCWKREGMQNVLDKQDKS